MQELIVVWPHLWRGSLASSALIMNVLLYPSPRAHFGPQYQRLWNFTYVSNILNIIIKYWSRGRGVGVWLALPVVTNTGMCHANHPVLSHFFLKLSMKKASFTFIMPAKFVKCIPYFMTMAVHDNSSKGFCKAMPKTDPRISSLDLEKHYIMYRHTQITTVKKISQIFFFFHFFSHCLCLPGYPYP